MDPVFLGRYPEDGLARFGGDMPRVSDTEIRTIHEPLDFMGVNIYFGTPARMRGAGPGGTPVEARLPEGHPATMMQWPVTPEALYWGPRFMHERYAVPLYITENGMAAHDWVHGDGAVHDPGRIDFLRRYLLELRRARAEGVDVRGFFQWSFMDNFEWTEGYRKRFGLVYVDYASQRRIPKDSFRWYQRVIASNGAALEG
jgi:beta-glucosidase